MDNRLIYLDYAAATPLDDAVELAMRPYLSENFYNPSATYDAARAVRADLEAARARIAYWLGCRPSEIIFTAGATEANNLAIHGIMRRYPEANIVISAIEHESVIEPANRYDCRTVRVNSDGRLDLNDLEQKIDDRTVLVSLMQANNEIGVIQPLHEIAKIVSQKRKQARKLPLYFHSDGAQAGNYLDLHVNRSGVDLMSLNGGKIYGPKQSGVLYVKAGIELQPLISGGGQERGLRSGTENVAAAIGLSLALDKVQQQRHDESARVAGLQSEFLKLVKKQLPDAVINGSLKYRLVNNIHLTLPGVDNERLLIQLDEAGIMAAAGSACSASKQEASHVLRAIGLDDAAARASLRFSIGQQTSSAMIQRVVAVLGQLT